MSKTHLRTDGERQAASVASKAYRIMVDGAGPRTVEGVPTICAAVVALSPRPNSFCLHQSCQAYTSEDGGPLTSVMAELLAITAGLELAVAIREKDPEAIIMLFNDAKWCVDAVNGVWDAVRATHLVDLIGRARFLKSKTGATIKWFGRENNNLADRLSKSYFNARKETGPQ